MSTLMVTHDDLEKIVGWYLGYGRTVANWSTDQNDDVQVSVDSGQRMVYNAHNWSFLEPTTTITVWGSITGTISAVNGTGNLTITASESVFYPTCVGHTLVTSSENSYTIATYVSGTQITTTASALADNGDTFTITATGDYILPTDFGSFVGDLTHATGSGYHDIKRVSEAQIRSLRVGSDYSGTPKWVATQFMTTTLAADQRQEMLVYPKPDGDYVLSYKYRILPDKLVATTNEYPYGAETFSELIREACLAAAEQEVNEEAGIHTQKYQALLLRAVQLDGQNGADTLGVPRSASDVSNTCYRRGGICRYVGFPS
jgi:hypothetical protein